LSDFYCAMTAKSPEQIYDELLVLKSQQGSKDAFSELVAKWQKRLWHYALQITRSESAAWDVVQETWVAIIKGLSKLQDVTLFSCWTFSILNNKCADWVRKQQLQSQLNSRLATQTQNYSDKEQGGNEKTESLETAIERLPTDQRALLSLRYQQDFDISEIAEILAIPEGTVKSRLHRTLAELREIMGANRNG